jgi:phospholipid/cholesterol/gamma-HCH transport system substrate-binding protein
MDNYTPAFKARLGMFIAVGLAIFVIAIFFIGRQQNLALTAAKTEIASQELGEIMTKINSGEGTLGALINDETMAGNLNQTINSLMRSSHGLDENMQALKQNFFFRRYYRRIERDELRRIEEEIRLENQLQEQIEMER